MKKLFKILFICGMICVIIAVNLSCVTTPALNRVESNTTSENDSSNPLIIDLRITDTNRDILNNFDNLDSNNPGMVYYSVQGSSDSYEKLLWNYGQSLYVVNKQPDPQTDGIFTQLTDTAGSVFGECVSAVRALVAQPSIQAGGSNWIKGDWVMDRKVTPGTVVATFTADNGLEFDPSGNSHTAIFKGYTNNGFEVWDQNWDDHNEPNWDGHNAPGGHGDFGKHYIYTSGTGNSNANNYYVVQIKNTVQTSETAVTPISSTTTTFEQILSAIPDTPVNREEVDINDYAQLRKAFQINAPNTNATVDEQMQYITDLCQADNFTNPDAIKLAAPVGIFNNNTYLEWSIEAMQNLGLGFWSIDQEVETGFPSETIRILKGQFSMGMTKQALAISAENDPPSTETYSGNTIFSWGGDNQINLLKTQTPPAYDELGRGGRYVIQSNYVFRTNDTPEIKTILDTQNGKVASLNDVSEFNLMAKELSSQGALTALMTDKTQSVEYVKSKLTAIGNFSPQDLDNYLAKGPKLLPYQTTAVGVGKDSKGLYALVILVNPDAQTAAKNVTLLQQRIKQTSSIYTGEPWTSTISSSSITSNGRVLTAKLYGNSMGKFWFSWYNSIDPLILCD